MAIYLLLFLLCASLAIMHELKTLQLNKNFYALCLLVLALFAGMRYQVGQDWDAYQRFFDGINTSDKILAVYRSGPQQFEIGYYSLNLLIKLMGCSYSIVFLVIAIFFAFSIYIFTKSAKMNKFYFLAIYLSYSFLVLNFAQVRQACAIGFLLLGCSHYLSHQNKLQALAIATIGVLFQYTALMYIVPMGIVLYWPKNAKITWIVAGIAVVGTAIYLVNRHFDFYTILAYLAATESAQDKVAVYREAQTEQGIWQIIYSGYLVFLVVYCTQFMRSVEPKFKFIIQYAIVSLLITILFIGVFPGSYVMYSRAYVVASIFQGYAAALIFSGNKYRAYHKIVFAISLVVSFVFFYRLISTYSDEYTPYRTIIYKNNS